MTLKDAVKTLTTTYGSLDVAARGMVVNSKEVADALAKANPESVEFVALSVLAKMNPYTPPTKSE